MDMQNSETGRALCGVKRGPLSVVSSLIGIKAINLFQQSKCLCTIYIYFIEAHEGYGSLKSYESSSHIIVPSTCT